MCLKTFLFIFKFKYFVTIKSILMNEYQHKSTRINTSPTRINTNQHGCDTSQQESKLAQHESTQVSLDHEIIVVFKVLQLVKNVNSLIGLNITLRHYLELGSKEYQEQIGRNLVAIGVFINSFSLLGVKYQFICQE